MTHIAICDDEQSFVSHLQALLSQYARETGEKIKVTVFYDGMDLVEQYDPTTDLIFLDIQMKLMDGLQTAARLRQLDAHVGIIFLTTLAQYGLEGYKYQAADYILKPIAYVRLKAVLDKFLEEKRRQARPSVVVVNDTGKYKVLLRDLRYVETFNRSLLLHTEQENLLCCKSMKEVERELQAEGFARCHTSYIVNLFYVKGVKKLELRLITGEVLPISQPRRKEFMQRLTEYWGARL